jgi:acetyl esterase/lipase
MASRMVRNVSRWVIAGAASLLVLGWGTIADENPSFRLAWKDLNYVDPAETGPEHLLDIYLPTDGAGPFPVAIYIPGSAWSSNNSKGSGALIASLLAPEGVATVAVNHRGTVTNPGAVFPAQLHDVKAAVRYVRATAVAHNLDAERIMVFGGSSGGHLAALLGTTGGVYEWTVGSVTMDLEGNLGPYAGTSSRVLAVCEAAGPTDFLQLNTCPEMPPATDHDAAGSPASRLIGGPIQEHPDECALANPITYADPSDPPFAIFHGDEDTQVPWCQSRLLYQALRASHVPVVFTLVEGANHNNLSTSQEAVDKIVSFIKEMLIPEDEGPP